MITKTKEEWADVKREVWEHIPILFQQQKLADVILPFLEKIDSEDENIFLERVTALFFLYSNVRANIFYEEMALTIGSLLSSVKKVDEDTILTLAEKASDIERKIIEEVKEKKINFPISNNDACNIFLDLIKTSQVFVNNKNEKAAMILIITDFADRTVEHIRIKTIKTTDVGLA